ncbi:TetR family transcriptional regulator [Kitasatospora sp. Root107]|uniref:TetR family transcriptional regulator n=1 Tax=Kitasatospora sp. Root107 TaxID=1736424 RepID=UPI00070A8EFC|nr:TetR family transcriptional regulator [Kitasatospora sp. Root107]KQV11878.1 transcriptional regulator [Kitasatospora sp. Root107]
MSHTSGARQAQKQQTRRALLDAALHLLEGQNLSSLGVREVTREAGMSPAGFYRHFRDMADLGVTLVEESLASLHGMVLAVLAGPDEAEELIDRAVDVVAGHVREHRAHIRFLARERHGGVRPVREAIGAELARFADEVAAALADQPASAGWSAEDLLMLAELYVEHLVSTATAFLDVPEDRPELDLRISRVARRQLRLISVGRRHWRDS